MEGWALQVKERQFGYSSALGPTSRRALPGPPALVMLPGASWDSCRAQPHCGGQVPVFLVPLLTSKKGLSALPTGAGLVLVAQRFCFPRGLLE